MGHYLMDNLSGKHESASGNHSSQTENIFTLAWNEGWATGFMSMVDQYYRSLDNEYGNYAFLEQVGFTNNRYPTELRDRTRLASGAPRNGMKSEYHISTFLYDLYDGPTKFDNTTPSISYNDAPNSSNSTYLARTGFDSPLTDDLELTAAQIFAPLVFAKQNSFGVYSINQYYRLLVRQLNDCGQPKKVQKLLTQNGILDWTPNQATNTNVLSTDLIGNKLTMTGYYGPFGALSVSDNYYNDINELSGTSQNFNLGLAVATTDYQGITDVLEVKNGAKLGINANMNIGFSSGPVSANNSTLYVHVCNQTLTINNSSTLEIGGTQRIGILTIKGGTSLILKSGSTLDIKANSSLILESGANLIFEKGASIKLAGTTSIFVVKHGGKIQIGKDAIFNYSGDGFIRFETAYPISSSIEAIGPNAQFKLVGGAFGTTSKKLIEVTGGQTLADLTTYNSPSAAYNLALFSVQNGNIVLSSNSRIVVSGTNTKADFRSLAIMAAIQSNTSTRHRGIVVNGQLGNMFYKVNITDAITGITALNIYGGADIDLLQVTATRCGKAIYILGKGARIQDPNISYCDVGIELEGMTNSTRLYKAVLFYNKKGINALNCIGNVIELYQPHIYSNLYGIYGNNSQYTATCGLIRNSSSALPLSSGKYDGANVHLQNNSNLILDPSMRPSAGRVDMTNPRSVAVRQDNAAYGPFLNQSGSSLLTDIDYSIVGTVVNRPTTSSVYPSLPASNNIWGYTNGVSRSAISLVDYKTEYQYGSLGTRNVDYIDNSQIPYFTPCSQGSGGGIGQGGDGGERMRGYIGGEITPIKDLPNKQLADGSMMKEKIQEGYNYFFDIAPNYSQAINSLTNALNYNFNSSDLEEWGTAITIVNSQLSEALSEGISEGNISVYNGDSTTYSEYVMQVLNLQDKLIQGFETDPQYVFITTLNKAAIQRMLGDRTSAIQTLNNMEPNLFPELNSSRDAFICMTTKEKLLLEGSIDFMQFDTLYDCNIVDYASMSEPYYYELDENNELVKNDSSITPNLVKFPIKIYPNPNEGIFNVNFKGEEASNYSIEVIDILGKKVYSSAGIVLLNNNIEINLANLNTGTYFIKVVNGSNAETQKVMIVK